MKKRKTGRWNPGNTKYSDDDRKKVIEYFKNHNNNSDRAIAEALGYDISFVNLTTLRYWKEKEKQININRKNKTNEKFK